MPVNQRQPRALICIALPMVATRAINTIDHHAASGFRANQFVLTRVAIRPISPGDFNRFRVAISAAELILGDSITGNWIYYGPTSLE